MIYEEIKTPFRVYDSLDKQDHLLKGNDIGSFELVSFKDSILPFQFLVPSATIPSITSWKIGYASGEVYLDISSQSGLIELRQKADEPIVYVVFKGGGMTLDMAPGRYFFEITIDGSTYFSEIFTVLCNSPLWADTESDFLRLEWGNSCDLGPILYQTGFKNILLLDTDIDNEAPALEQEGEEDNAGNFHPTSQKYVENLSFTEVVPFYLGEALVLMAMHNDVVMTTKNGVYSGAIREIAPALEMMEGTSLYRYTAKFQQDSKYFVGGCCSNMELV